MAQRNGFINGKNIAYDFEPFLTGIFIRDAIAEKTSILILGVFFHFYTKICYENCFTIIIHNSYWEHRIATSCSTQI